MYSEFARYYDILMHNVNYKERADYIISLFKLYNREPLLVLDAACGTGNIALEMATKGFQVIGVDISPEMLTIAQNKALASNLDILFLCQDLLDLDLYGTIDSVVCTMDSVNHILCKNDLQKVFKNISLFTETDGIFIFDANTIYKHKEILGQNCFILETSKVFCAWQNEYSSKDEKVRIELDFFIKEKGLYRRSCESFVERAYTDLELKNMLLKADFELLNIYEDMTLSKPSATSERNVYISRKI